jgi:hypothetical protein
MDYIVEVRYGGGSSWSRYGRDSNESQAIRMAEGVVRNRGDASARVVDSNGNVRHIV